MYNIVGFLHCFIQISEYDKTRELSWLRILMVRIVLAYYAMCNINDNSSHRNGNYSSLLWHKWAEYECPWQSLCWFMSMSAGCSAVVNAEKVTDNSVRALLIWSGCNIDAYIAVNVFSFGFFSWKGDLMIWVQGIFVIAWIGLRYLKWK